MISTYLRSPALGVGVVTSSERPLGQDWREEERPIDTAPEWTSTRAIPEDWGCASAEDGREMLRRQICPICGTGPWKSPLNHAARKHGVLKRDLREAVGLTSVESVIAPELRDRFAESQRAIGRDMAALSRRGPRGKYRMTQAGREALRNNLATWEREHPEEAQAQRRAAGAKGRSASLAARAKESR